MIETLSELLGSAITSPWVYLALFAAAVLDGVFPLVPCESLVIAAGVFATSGSPNLAGVIAAAAAGAVVGDHLAYLAGRQGGSHVVSRLPAGSRRRAAFDRAARTLGTRGGLMLVACRYLPGVRVATTATAGAVGYPLRRFAAFDLLASVTWAVYSVLIGVLGGAAFEQNPVLGVAFGIAVAMLLTGVTECVRHLVRRRRAGSAAALRSAPAVTAQGTARTRYPGVTPR